MSENTKKETQQVVEIKSLINKEKTLVCRLYGHDAYTYTSLSARNMDVLERLVLDNDRGKISKSQLFQGMVSNFLITEDDKNFTNEYRIRKDLIDSDINILKFLVEQICSAMDESLTQFTEDLVGKSMESIINEPQGTE